MQSWGFLLLGASAAMATIFILTKVRITGSLLLLLALSPLYTSAALVFFHPQFQNFSEIRFYPGGLLISFLWQQAWPLTERIQGEWLKKWMPTVVCGFLAAATVCLVIHSFWTS